jgi:hypothetical protein
MEELADLLEYLVFVELMIVVQPEFNKSPFEEILDSQGALDIQEQYFQLIELRRRSRMLICLLDKCYTVKQDGKSLSIIDCFVQTLTDTAAELNAFFKLFRKQELQGDHYSESGMRRNFMLCNLNRVARYWDITITEATKGMWGSSNYRGGSSAVSRTVTDSKQQQSIPFLSWLNNFCPHLFLPSTKLSV